MIHNSEEDAELTLKAAIKMLWLKQKGLKNRSQNLCWYENIYSREYDELSLRRLDQVLEKFYDIQQAARLKDSQPNQSQEVVELCAG